ncbi:XRE family transcriptional regulator [Brevundimonas vesicularis]|nr:LexA family transcriptional regulator [Brevundimonas vesicularis]
MGSVNVVDDDIAGPYSDFADRLRAAMGAVPQTLVAKRADMSLSGFNQLLKGRSEPGAFKLARIAKVLGVSLEWLATGDGKPNSGPFGYVDIPLLDVRLAAGAGSITDLAKQIGVVPMTREMLQIMGMANAEGLRFVMAEGDSMEPLISDESSVLVDIRDTRLREGVFAFRLGDELRIKRLRRLGVDGVEVISENPRYEPEVLQGHDLEQFAILGRALGGFNIY